MRKAGELLNSSRILGAAFREHCVCIEDVYRKLRPLLKLNGGLPQKFKVKMGQVPSKFYLPRKNIFSTFFQSVYYLLGVSRPRRLLYGKLNHLFRIWVTAADNLLDNEDKVTVPIKMCGNSRVMRQVISVMAADRVMKEILDEAVGQKVITRHEAAILSAGSLQILLPSAAEEASEEGGVIKRPRPEYVLHTINRLKTGLLFYIPFLGPENIEKNIQRPKLRLCKQGLINFGLGCQIADDIRDLARDYTEKRHNYILSELTWKRKNRQLEEICRLAEKYGLDGKIFTHFRKDIIPAANLGYQLMAAGLISLNKAGLDLEPPACRKFAEYMFKILDIKELILGETR